MKGWVPPASAKEAMERCVKRVEAEGKWVQRAWFDLSNRDEALYEKVISVQNGGDATITDEEWFGACESVGACAAATVIIECADGEALREYYLGQSDTTSMILENPIAAQCIEALAKGIAYVRTDRQLDSDAKVKHMVANHTNSDGHLLREELIGYVTSYNDRFASHETIVAAFKKGVEYTE